MGTAHVLQKKMRILLDKSLRRPHALMACIVLVLSLQTISAASARDVRTSVWASGYSHRGIVNLRAVDRRIVDDHQYPGIVTLLAKNGKVLALDAYGKRDLAGKGRPMRPNTIFEIASMTKPLTATAMMILYEEGKWAPQDPLSKYIPQFAHLKVYEGMRPDGQMILEDPIHPPTMGELLSHTAGFTYGAFGSTPVDQMYRSAMLFQQGSLQGMIDRLSHIPLLYQPGTRWVYSLSADIEGYLVQALSGEPFPKFLKQHIFDPLGMRDTDFYVPRSKRDRLAVIYQPGPHGALQPVSYSAPDHEPAVPSGGSGLYSTAEDYYRFAQMLLNGGELNGVRILSPATVRLMTSNHLSHFTGGGTFLPTTPGIGYGYDVGVYTHPVLAGSPVGTDTYFWGGLYGTLFWVDPANHLGCIAMVQRSDYRWTGNHADLVGNVPNLPDLLQAAVYSGLTDPPHGSQP